MKSILKFVAWFALVLFATVPLPAQSKADKSDAENKNGPEGRIARWFELQTAILTTRYRFIENSRGITTTNQLQHKEAFKGRFKFDPNGNYSINAGVFSGNNFIGSWNNTGIGTGGGATNLHLRQLYFSAKPLKGLELQYGGLYLLRGESTEITSYDDDGYVVGERIVLKRPKDLFFDEIGVTYGHLGDILKPSITKRFHRLRESNYHQFLVSKKIGKRAVVSADYTFVGGAETMREAIKINAKELRVVDSIRFENYQRTHVKPDYGFGIYGEKALLKRLTVGGGYARIDPNYGGLNADRFNKGNRVYLSSTLVIRREFSVSTFLTRAVANHFAVDNRTRFDVVFSYNLLKSLKRTGIF